MSCGSIESASEYWRALGSIPASSATIACPIGCVAPVTTQTKPYSFPSERYREKGEELSMGSGMMRETAHVGACRACRSRSIGRDVHQDRPTSGEGMTLVRSSSRAEPQGTDGFLEGKKPINCMRFQKFHHHLSLRFRGLNDSYLSTAGHASGI